MTSLSSFSLLEPDTGSVLELSSQALAPLIRPGVGATSLEGQRRAGGGSAAPTHVTFRAKVKSSGYGSTAAPRPCWAIAKAARARGVSRSVSGSGAPAAIGGDGSVSLHTSHPSPTPELTREDRHVFGAPPASALVMASAAAMPGGPVACLAFSSLGDALCIGAHAGDFYTAPLDVAQGNSKNLRAGAVARKTGLPGRALSCSFSAGTFANITSGVRCGAGGGGGSGIGSGGGEKQHFAPFSGGGVDFAVATAAARVRSSRGKDSDGGLRTAPPSRLLLGAGDDAAAYLWATGAGAPSTPLLTFRSPGGGDATASGGGGAPFPERVSHAHFAYLDRLVLLACGPRIYALRFSLGDEGEEGAGAGNGKTDEDTTAARRRDESRRYKLVASWAAADCGSVVALAAPNAWRSPLVFAAFSDRSVRVFDLSAAGGGGDVGVGIGAGVRVSGVSAPPEVLRITDAHARAVHTLAIPTASALCDVAEASLDCLLTAATDGCVRLWDVRTAACARSLTGGHTNRAGIVGAAISPCATFVAAGSECGRTAVYDLRTGEPISRLAGARDVVTAVAWHPAVPRLAVGSLDGGVRFFAPGLLA